MTIEIRQHFEFTLYGFSGTVPNFNFGEVGIALSGRMWKIVKENKMAHDGINIWAYDSQREMFAGVRINPDPVNLHGLEKREFLFAKYAWYKHVGPYHKLMEANSKMREELTRRGVSYGSPSLEIYCHHEPDESKVETEIIYTVEL